MQNTPPHLIIVAHDAAQFLSHRIEGKAYDVAFAMQAKSPVFAPLVG